MFFFDLLLIFLAFITAVIDIIIGVGFGLTMTPLLLFLNYPPKEIVPALLLSSLVGNGAVKDAILFKENHSGESVQRILVYKIIV